MKNIRRPYAKVCARHEEEFLFKEARDQNILLYLRSEGHSILLRTYARRTGKSSRFFIDGTKLNTWLNTQEESFVDFDCGNILRIDYDAKHSGYRIHVWWLHGTNCNGGIAGKKQDFFVPDWVLHGFITDEWQKVLCKLNAEYVPPKFIWTESARKNLRAIAAIPSIRKAFLKAWARNTLNWPDTEITMYADSPANIRDFFFRTSDGICGGLIAHAGKTAHNTPKWEYSTHT